MLYACWPAAPDGLVRALGGRLLTLDDFCRTRLIEVLLPLDDLAVSIGESRTQTDPEGVAIVVDIMEGIARHPHGDWEVLDALAVRSGSENGPCSPSSDQAAGRASAEVGMTVGCPA